MDVSKELEAIDAQVRKIQVEKIIPVEFDLGLLTAFDMNPIDQHVDMQAYARDGVQLLFNQLFSLPMQTTEDGIMARLSAPSLHLPREKPIPKPKALSKWEKFAKKKGIQKKKNSHMAFDEESGEYKPVHGRHSAKNENLNQWLHEVPENTPYVNQFDKLRQEKRERIEKNQKQQKKNLAQQLATVQKSTASRGRFDKTLPNEKKKPIPNKTLVSKDKELSILKSMNLE